MFDAPSALLHSTHELLLLMMVDGLMQGPAINDG